MISQTTGLLKRHITLQSKKDMTGLLMLKTYYMDMGFKMFGLTEPLTPIILKNLFKERLNDTFLYDWREQVENTSKIQTYSKIKKHFGVEEYLSSIHTKPFPYSITKLVQIA